MRVGLTLFSSDRSNHLTSPGGQVIDEYNEPNLNVGSMSLDEIRAEQSLYRLSLPKCRMV